MIIPRRSLTTHLEPESVHIERGLSRDQTERA